MNGGYCYDSNLINTFKTPSRPLQDSSRLLKTRSDPLRLLRLSSGPVTPRSHGTPTHYAPNHGTPTTPSPNTFQRHQTPRNLPRHPLLRPYSLLRTPTPSKLYKQPLSHSSPSCILFFPQATIILLPPSSSPSSKLPLQDRPPLARPSTTFPLPLRHDLRGFPFLKLGRLATVTVLSLHPTRTSCPQDLAGPSSRTFHPLQALRSHPRLRPHQTRCLPWSTTWFIEHPQH